MTWGNTVSSIDFYYCTAYDGFSIEKRRTICFH
uniref:Uncharacterized protein n=1 Tax=Salmonella phage vB_SEnST11_KE23 TaxID=3161174 RepID=A0AAU8GEK2_9CAUD